jgi:ferredoxin
MRIILDRSRCSGIGICESISPDYFEMADDGSLVLLAAEVDESDRPTVEEAIRSCPTVALSMDG